MTTRLPLQGKPTVGAFTIGAWLQPQALGSRRRSRSAAAAQRTSGQILPAALGLMLVIGGMFYLMVNSGQTVVEKIRVTNAADAAAYSAGVVEARALNYDAYLNRAMVANEIAIAQMVSAVSWANYAATAQVQFPPNVYDINLLIAPNPIAAYLSGAFSSLPASALATSLNALSGPAIAAHDGVVVLLSASQTAVQATLTAAIAQQAMADTVVHEMDPALVAEVVLATHGFDFFTKSYGRGGAGGDERARFADVTLRSRDAFTRERNWTQTGLPLLPFDHKNGALKKRGGTDLIGYDEWRAVDTLELHGNWWGCSGFLGLIGWCSDVRTPLGAGAAEVDAGAGDADRGFHGNAYGENSRTAGWADGSMVTPPGARFSGLPSSRDLDYPGIRGALTTGITVLVSKPQAATLTSGNAALAKPGGRLALFNGRPAGGRLAALSRAEVYFDRVTPRNDGRKELGSLYNPYWRVRLVSPTAIDTAYAASQQGGLALP
jgi:Putative Flp pilus-assembly TadE/G-like